MELCGITSKLCGLGIKILADHKRDLEGDRVLKFAQIKSRKLTYLIKTVNESVSVYKELS